MLPRVLCIESHNRTRALLQYRLTGGVKLKFAPCIDAAWEKLDTRKFDLILWNTASDPAAEMNLDETLKLLSAKVSGSRVVVLANSLALHAPRSRDDNILFADLPASQEDLLALVESNLPLRPSSESSACQTESFGVPIDFEGIIAVSLPMRAVIRRALDAAATDIPVLITGETGTGKDLLAAAIHRRSSRRNKPYIPVNVGAMARELIASEIFGHERGAYTGAQDTRPGIFEQGHGGTVFLDEVATMDERTQISLLRVLEEKTFRRVGGSKNIGTDVRVIAATNEDLEKNVADKRFREDLFYRLNVFPIRIPPLRERISAITALTNHFVSRFGAIYGKDVERIAPETYRLLRRYPWPGNVRELKNVVQTAILMIDGSELTPELLPQRIKGAAATSERCGETTCSFQIGATLDFVQKELIRLTLARMGGNKKLAASVLGISRRALYNKIRKS